MMKKRLSGKRILRLSAIALALLLLLGAAVYAAFIQPNLEQETYIYKEETVLRGDVVQGVMESGSISMGETAVRFDVEVNTEEDEDEEDEEDEDYEDIRSLEIEEVFVVSGQRIKTGDPLFSFTEKSRKGVMKKLTLALTEKEIALSQARADYNSQVLEAKGTYDTSMLTANTASSLLDASVTQLQEEINGLQAQTAVLELEVNQCLEKLTEEDFTESLEDARTAYQKAKEKYEETSTHVSAAYTANYQSYTAAKQQYESLLSEQEEWEETVENNQKTILENNETILEKQSILEAKQADAQNTYDWNITQGQLAEEIYSYTKESLQSSVDSAQEACDSARETLEELSAFLGEEGVVYADGDGIVTNIYYEAGDKLTQSGTLLTYGKDGDYTVSIDVSEEDIAQISVGDSVQIVLEAYPEEKYTGTVSAVTTTKTSDYAKTVSYPVEILIEGDTQKLYGGMTAEITFVTDQVTDVLFVSRKAIVTQDGKSYVYVGEGEEKELKEVVTGFMNSTTAEIKEGLSEGDTVYIRSSAG